MGVVLPLLALCSLSALVAALAGLWRSWAWGLAVGFVGWVWASVVVGESLGAFGALGASGLLVAHGLVTALAAVVAVRHRPPRPPSLRALHDPVVAVWAVVVTLLVATVVTTAPNNPDSLAYHLVKIDQWWSQGSLAHVITPYPAQVYLPPGAELTVLPFVGDSRGWVALAGLVQLLALVATATAASLLTRHLGGDVRARRLAVVLATLSPVVVSEAATTQNDLLVAAALTTAAAAVTASPRHRWRAGVVLALAAGVAVATKPTALLFLPALLVWGAVRSFRSRHPDAPERRVRPLRAGAVLVSALALVVLPNLGWTLRNVATFGAPLGPPSVLTVESPTPAGALANAARSTGHALATPVAGLGRAVESGVAVVVDLLGEEVDDPDWLYGSDRFVVDAQRSEDRAPFGLQAVLLVGALLALVAGRSRPARRPVTQLVGVLALDWLLFSAALRWQPWGGRLLLPVVVLVGVAVALVLSRWPRWTQLTVVALVVTQCLPWILFSTWRPLVGDRSVVASTTSTELFAPYPDLEGPVRAAVDDLVASGVGSIGLGENTYPVEYPVRWLLRRATLRDVTVVHLDVTGPTARLGPPVPPAAGLCVCDREPDLPPGSVTRRHGPVLVWTPAP